MAELTRTAELLVDLYGPVKVYIAGPMTGLPGYNFDAFRAQEKILGEVEGITPVVPIEPGDLSEEGSAAHAYHFYILRGLGQLAECQLVVLLEGWTASSGATLEAWFARAVLSLPVYSVSLWEKGQYVKTPDAAIRHSFSLKWGLS